MNGLHDMGGMDGFGRVEPEADEPVFHSAWEGRVIAMMRAMGLAGAWNLDMFRAARESQPGLVYLSASYYKSWEIALETLALGHGFVAADEIAAGHSLHPAKALPRATLRAVDVRKSVKRGSYGRPAAAPARFKPGDNVRARNLHPASHTRLPRYVRGRVGVIERLHGAHVFPDSSALGRGDDAQWLYTVAFEARELWGDDAEPGLKVSIDAFEPYLEIA